MFIIRPIGRFVQPLQRIRHAARLECVIADIDGFNVDYAFPFHRQSIQLKQAASACFTIGRAKLAASQLPERVRLPSGFELQRPSRWA